MPNAKTEPTLVRAGNHSVTISPFNDMGFKEEVFLYFNTTWRGQPVAVTMQADRYTHSSGISEWRIYIHEAKEGSWDPETSWYAGGRAGVDLSSTARQRLSPELRPIVEQWLASPAYVVSERLAYVSAIRGQMYDAKPYSAEPTRDARTVMTKYFDKLTPAQRKYLTRLADAYDAFAKIYNEEIPS